MARDDERSTADPVRTPKEQPAGMPTPSGGDRTARRASDLTDDPDPGAGGGLDSRGDLAADLEAEPPASG